MLVKSLRFFLINCGYYLMILEKKKQKNKKQGVRALLLGKEAATISIILWTSIILLDNRVAQIMYFTTTFSFLARARKNPRISSHFKSKN